MITVTLPGPDAESIFFLYCQSLTSNEWLQMPLKTFAAGARINSINNNYDVWDIRAVELQLAVAFSAVQIPQ